jgi:hypothetical protein
MALEFANKSNTKRKKIFLERCRKLSLSIINVLESASGSKRTESEINAMSRELSLVIYDSVFNNLDKIYSGNHVNPMDSASLVDHLIERLSSNEMGDSSNREA